MRGILRSFMVSIWFMFLTFPICVIKVSPLDGSILWRWHNALFIGVGIFFSSFVWRAMLVRKGISTAAEADLEWLFTYLADAKNKNKAKALAFFLLGNIPFFALILIGGLTRFLTDLRALEPYAVLVLLVAHIGMFMATGILSGKGSKVSHAFSTLRKGFAGSARVRCVACVLLLLCVLPLPYVADIYQTNILASAFIWIMLGLGLNIVVGQAGMLVLGYVAFYAVGAYTYAYGNMMFGSSFVGFWMFLPLGGLLAMLAGILLCLPVLRLRGDYLAIVTLGFGEIVRVILEGGSLSFAPLFSLLPQHWVEALPTALTGTVDLGGPAGIGGIAYPGFFGIKLSVDDSIRYVYYIAFGMTIFTMVAVSRLRNSRLGRSWLALREDEIACEAMGINKGMTKLSAFALSACWAGFGGVLFAAKTTFINPTSFTFMESALILSVVVLGGLDSIIGVALGACVLILLPEYLRFLDEYRMLIFGASMVLMMVFRPQGLIPARAKKWIVPKVRIKETTGEV